MNRNTAIIILFVVITGFSFSLQAATHYLDHTSCGCNCNIAGDTYILTEDMNCSEHGLVVGAHEITIDGGNHAIIGASGAPPIYYGIDDSAGYDTIVIQNFSNITAFESGVYLVNSTGSTIKNITSNSNKFNGIHLESSSNNNLGLDGEPSTGNTFNSNNARGIYIEGGSGNHLNYNTANSQSCGIYIDTSDSNILTGNTVDSNNTTGVSIDSSSKNRLVDNTIRMSAVGVYMGCSPENILISNNIESNYRGVVLCAASTTDNTLTGNRIAANAIAIDTLDSSSNTIMANVISESVCDTSSETINNFSLNRSNYNIANKMLTFTETPRAKNVGDTINFSVSSFDANGSDCNGCVTVTTSPAEEVIIDAESGNDISGHFTPTKLGTYSLNFAVTDENSNITRRRMVFLIGDTDCETTKYYIRGVTPTHGQQPYGTGNDSKTLLLTVPESIETLFCSTWVQASPDVIPNYPLANLSDIDTYTWYKLSSDVGFVGAQRYFTYDRDVTVDLSTHVPASANYIWTGLVDFTDLNWAMDYPCSWYWLTLKLYGGELGSPRWVTFPAGYSANEASYANFTYEYTTTPAVKSISNPKVLLLSATEPVDDPGNATIVLDGTDATDTSTDIVLDNYSRPFIGYVTTINSNGTSTLHATNIDEEVTINSVNMEITPDTGSVDVQIAIWNPYHRVWAENASETGITATHTTGGLLSNTYYEIRKDGVLIGLYLADATGKITFSCTAGSIFTMETPTTGSEDSDEYQCFLTRLFAATGTDDNKILCKIRDFRDNYLLTNPIGKIFVSAYYRVSPQIADFMGGHPVLRNAVRNMLKPIVWFSRQITKKKF